MIYDRKKKVNGYQDEIKKNPKTDFLSSPAYVEIRKNIMKENRLQKIECLLFSNEYYKFMDNLL